LGGQTRGRSAEINKFPPGGGGGGGDKLSHKEGGVYRTHFLSNMSNGSRDFEVPSVCFAARFVMFLYNFSLRAGLIMISSYFSPAAPILYNGVPFF
jgi:hypothetical protein